SPSAEAIPPASSCVNRAIPASANRVLPLQGESSDQAAFPQLVETRVEPRRPGVPLGCRAVLTFNEPSGGQRCLPTCKKLNRWISRSIRRTAKPTNLPACATPPLT